MALDLLDAPLRMTWDLNRPDGEAMPAPLARLVASRLVDAGVFYVNLGVRPLVHPAFAEVLTQLAEEGVRVETVFTASDEEWPALDAALTHSKVLLDAGALLAKAKHLGLAELFACVTKLRQHQCEPVLFFIPDRQRLHLIPQLLDFCRQVGITRFKLPNTPIDASFDPETLRKSLPTPEDLAFLRQTVTNPLEMRRGVQMEVHDLFLWEIFFAGERETGRVEYGGCQAANSLGHVDVEGRVHPCSSWPQHLGSLRDESLDVIWAGAERLRIRAAVGQAPSGCVGCRDYGICFGGCRGMTRTLAAAGDGRDLLCQARR